MTDLLIPEAFLPLWTGTTSGIPRIEHYAFYGGRGGAKSHSIAEAVIGLACKQDERIVCGRQYQSSIKDSVKELLEKKIYKMGMAPFFRSTDSELQNMSTGARFTFTGMDRNPDSAKSLEGATIFWGEEAAMFTERSVEIIIPTIRAPGSRMIWSWNPRFRTDPVDVMFRGMAPPEASYIKEVSWRNNPYFKTTRMPSELKRSARVQPRRHQHIWEGAYDENPELAIFENWRVGIVEVDIKLRPRFGMDFGFSSDPNAVVKAYLIEEEGIIYVAAEAYANKVPNRKLKDIVDSVPESRDWTITCDSSRPETIEQLQSDGFMAYPARKGAGSIKNGLNFLSGYEIVVHPSCENFAEEVRTYVWSSDPQGRALPLPAEKQPDHGIDALRYAFEQDATMADPGSGSDEILYL